MKNLTVASVIEKNKLSSNTPFLVCLDIEVVNPETNVVVETLHYVRNAENITFNGYDYEAAPFEIDLKEESGTQSVVNLKIKDFSRAIQQRMQAYGGGIGFNVSVIVVNAGALNAPPEIVEYFQVVGAEAANYEVTFSLGAENALAITFPRRRQFRDFCSWRYKDPNTCAYSGGMLTCDLTLQGPNGCAAHANTLNFGGYPGLNAGNVRYR